MTRFRSAPLQIYFHRDELAKLREHTEAHKQPLSRWARIVLLEQAGLISQATRTKLLEDGSLPLLEPPTTRTPKRKPRKLAKRR